MHINLHHSRAALAALSAHMTKSSIDVALIQEPWTHTGRVRGLDDAKGWVIVDSSETKARTRVLAKNGFKIPSIWNFCSRDLVCRLVMERKENERELTIGSAYMPHDYPAPPTTPEVNAFVEHCQCRRNWTFLLGCDANAHHTIWGRSDINKRGEFR